ncbi:MAG: hypothetical protein HYS78_02435, partial [Parcubacteria group bacterium]|nr:hypothetical protein [Parcubacteria group bacterium]
KLNVRSCGDWRQTSEKKGRPAMKNEPKIYFADGKAFLEISEGYPEYIGDESFIRSLDRRERRAYTRSMMLEFKNGTRNLGNAICLMPMSQTVH